MTNEASKLTIHGLMADIFCLCNFFALDAHEIWSQDSGWLAEPVLPFILRCLYPTWKLELCDWLTRVNVEMNSTAEQERLCGTHLVWIFKTSILYNMQSILSTSLVEANKKRMVFACWVVRYLIGIERINYESQLC